MSDTPRTLDLQAIIRRTRVNDDRGIVQMPTDDFNSLWEFARDFQRELADARAERDLANEGEALSRKHGFAWKERAEKAEAERDAAVRDAERYRWLCGQISHATTIPIAQCVWKRNSDPHGEWVNLVDDNDLTAHIDAAIAARKP